MRWVCDRENFFFLDLKGLLIVIISRMYFRGMKKWSYGVEVINE